MNNKLTCKHNWTTPPECPQCCTEERDRLEVESERLKAENARLAAALKFIYDECDWEQCGDGGDDRIGAACSEALCKCSPALSDFLAPTIEFLLRIRPTVQYQCFHGMLKDLDGELERWRSIIGHEEYARLRGLVERRG